VVRRDYLNAHRDLAQRYVDSLVQAVVKAKQDKAFTLQVLRKYQKVDDERLLEGTYDFYFGKEYIAGQPYLTVDQLKADLDDVASTNPKAASLDLNSLVDASFVKNAIGRGLDQ